MIEPRDRAAIARLHAAGLLGVTGIGWPLAAAYCGLALWGAVRRRDALMALQAAQAVLFQLGAGAVLLLLVTLTLLGFLVLGGSSDFLPELPVVDPFSAAGIALLVVWLLNVVAVPLWHLWSLREVIRAWRRSAAGELYAYPIAGPLAWEEAPRRLRWMVIREADEVDGEIESRQDHRLESTR